ncbi:MAG: transposase [Coprothermobacterota bacterium]|nr:transposase [Coprothermobacterota bacterium]
MARLARLVVPHLPHHVVGRGNRRLDVFFSDGDRIAYLDYLREACKRHGVVIWAYCLMSNHVHFVAVPAETDSLARCFSEAHVQYTRRINLREGWKGHLWQARFGSSVLDENHLIAAARYIERNPVRAGIVRDAWEYPWSSAAYHAGMTSWDRIVGSDELLRELIGDWKSYLQEDDSEGFLNSVRRDSFVNRPLGDEAFVNDLEKRFQMRLARGKAGRPVKAGKRDS